MENNIDEPASKINTLKGCRHFYDVRKAKLSKYTQFRMRLNIVSVVMRERCVNKLRNNSNFDGK